MVVATRESIVAAPRAATSFQVGAEDAASTVVDTILSLGGNELHKRYIHKKSFTFAADAGSTFALCKVMMSNPAHEHEDTEVDWLLEDEVTCPGPDCMTAKILPRPATAPTVESDITPPTEIQVQGLADGVRPKSAPAPGRRSRINPSSQNSDSSSQTSRSHTSRSGSKPNINSSNNNPSFPSASSSAVTSPEAKRVYWNLNAGKIGKDSRAFSIRDEVPIDEEEDKLRLAKFRDEALRKQRQEEERLKILEQEAEERREMAKRLAEEQDMRPYSYDIDGKVIYYQSPEELPNVQECFDIDVETSLNDRKEEVPPLSSLPMRKTPLPSEGLDRLPRKSIAGRGFARRSFVGGKPLRKHLKSDSIEFQDGFYKPEYMQPAIVDTMNVRAGVMLECMGQRRTGPVVPNAGQRMTRKEYIRYAQRRDNDSSSADGSATDTGSKDEVAALAAAMGITTIPVPRQVSKVTRPQSAPGGSNAGHMSAPALRLPIETGSIAADSSGNQAVGTIDVNSRPPSRGARPLVFSGGSPANNRQEPQAPAMKHRSKARSLSKGSQPRHRASLLGVRDTHNGRDGPIQPPIGATMGHGLLRDGSRKGAYYFPPSPAGMSAPSLSPSAIIRAASEPMLGSRGRAS